MTFEDFPDPNSPVYLLSARDRWQAIHELLDILVTQGKISSRNRPAIENAVVRRENVLSTSIGFGIGLPHALSDFVKEPIAIFGRSRRGINFEAYDKKPVFKVCLFLMPQSEFQKHAQFLANITKLLNSMDF